MPRDDLWLAPFQRGRPGGTEPGYCGLRKDKQVITQAMAACEVALKDAGAAQDRCQLLEAELKTMRSEHSDEARAAEWRRRR